MIKNLLYLAVIAGAMLLLARFLPGFQVTDWTQALIAALVLAVVNTLVRPVLFLLTLPFTLLTLGLFLVVLNAAMLGLAVWLVPGVAVSGFWPLLLASIGISFVTMVFNAVTKKR